MSDYMRRVHPDNAISRVTRWQTPHWDVYLQLNTGPPTWWIPQAICRTPAEVPRRGRGIELMVGWIRICTAITVVERRCHCGGRVEIAGMCSPCKYSAHDTCPCSTREETP